MRRPEGAVEGARKVGAGVFKAGAELKGKMMVRWQPICTSSQLSASSIALNLCAHAHRIG